ncbi:ornithine carbamoyltransferase [Acidimicrobiaceae bacterium USS-CC1]|uniref:Ornithine carbamoyltransferase n=1 Tax=Acidiferrimicrobium australe TaxID=2664430 RepID=A0ABW9QP99_9ACTN|nr:ornithine carbamoyltransferase [Acidiferrimicrobium australe]
MAVNLRHRNFLKELDFTGEELRYLVDLGAALKAAKAGGYERRTLTGRNIALIFEKTSTRTRSAFEVAAHDQGAHVTYLGPDESQIGAKESVRDTARVLGRMFDGIEYRGAKQDDIEVLGRDAGVPVWNGLTDEWHPTQMLADILTMQEHSTERLADVAYCYLGDARNNTARSLLVTGALLGMDVRVAAPRELWPDEDLRVTADRLAKESEARILVTTDVEQAVSGAGFVYTDVWLSMGEPPEEWSRRIDLLRPYQVNRAVLAATGNRHVRFMHCLPALHNRETRTGERLYRQTGLDALEVTEDVFESPASIVFDQAENRLHTIKAVMVATLGS